MRMTYGFVVQPTAVFIISVGTIFYLLCAVFRLSRRYIERGFRKVMVTDDRVRYALSRE